MKLRKYYPTVVLSDIHLGSEHSKTKEVTNFLKPKIRKQSQWQSQLQ